MPVTLTASEVKNITWEQLNQQLMSEPSIASGGDKRLKMHVHKDGSATISANYNVFSNAAEQKQLLGFVHSAIARSLGPSDLQQAVNAMPKIRANAIRADQLNDVDQAVNQARPGAWAARMNQNAHVQSVGLTNASIAPILGHAGSQVRPAGAGAGGALLVINSTIEPSGGVLIKTEASVVLKGATLVADLANHLPADLKAALPFGMVNYKAVDANDPGRALLVNALQAQVDDMNQKLLDPALSVEAQTELNALSGSIQNAIDGLNRPVGHKYHREIGQMELVPDSVQLNKLSFQDKVTLYNTPEFAQKLGQAMVACPMMGLNDHVGPALTNNASNFMINQRTGALTAIDYAANFNAVAAGKGPGGGDFNYGRPNPDQSLLSLATFADSAPATKGALINNLNDAITGGHEDSLFNAEDLKAYTPTANEVAAFELNLKIGITQGLNMVGQHINQFEQAYQELAKKEGLADQNQRPFVSRTAMENIANQLNVALNVPVPGVAHGAGGPPIVVLGDDSDVDSYSTDSESTEEGIDGYETDDASEGESLDEFEVDDEEEQLHQEQEQAMDLDGYEADDESPKPKVRAHYSPIVMTKSEGQGPSVQLS